MDKDCESSEAAKQDICFCVFPMERPWFWKMFSFFVNVAMLFVLVSFLFFFPYVDF